MSEAERIPLRRTGGMTRGQFLALTPTACCPDCGSVSLEVEALPPSYPHAFVAVCLECAPVNGTTRRLRWLAKDENATAQRRKPIPIMRSEVLTQFGGLCAGCGLSVAELEFLGLTWHVHHIEPYAEVGHDTQYLPLCLRCHEAVTAIRRDAVRQLKLWRDKLTLRERGDL